MLDGMATFSYTEPFRFSRCLFLEVRGCFVMMHDPNRRARQAGRRKVPLHEKTLRQINIAHWAVVSHVLWRKAAAGPSSITTRLAESNTSSSSVRVSIQDSIP